MSTKRAVEYWRVTYVNGLEDLRMDYLEELDGIRGLLLEICIEPTKFAQKVLTIQEGERLRLQTRWTFHHAKLQKHFEAWLEIVDEG